MNIRVYDNVLSDDFLIFIRKEISNMSWKTHASTPDDEQFFFACETNNYLSHQYLFDFFCNKYSFNYKKLRSYVNCYPPQSSGSFHPDDGDYTFLFYPDKTENKKGSTLFKNGSEVTYKTNRLLVFNARLVHKADKNLSNEMRHTIAWKTLK